MEILVAASFFVKLSSNTGRHLMGHAQGVQVTEPAEVTSGQGRNKFMLAQCASHGLMSHLHSMIFFAHEREFVLETATYPIFTGLETFVTGTYW